MVYLMKAKNKQIFSKLPEWVKVLVVTSKIIADTYRLGIIWYTNTDKEHVLQTCLLTNCELLSKIK